MMDGLMLGADRDLVAVWQKMNAKRFDNIMLGTRTSKEEASKEGLKVSFDQKSIRSEEHTSELQSRLHLVCRLLLEKKKMAPIATAMPPSDMMFAVRPIRAIGIKASTTAIGSVRIGISALRKWNKKKTMTRLTISISCSSSCQSVCTARWISSERS